MLREDGKVLQEVNEVLDLPLISQQISNGVYDFRSTTGYILGKMAQLCAPARDPVVRELVSTVETDLAATWDGVLRLLDDMKLDLANFRLQQLRPQLKLQAVEYERRKFDEGLECGRFSLERTKTWLESTSRNLLALAASRNPEKVDIPEAAPRFEDVYHEALLSLVFGTTAVNIANCPETLMLDAERIFAMQNDGQAATIVAALLILAKNMVPELRSNDAAAARLKQRLMTLLKDPEGGVTVENLSAELVASMNSVLAAKPRPPDVPEAKLGAEQEMMVKNMVDKTLAYRDAVFAMMQRRMQDKVRQTLQSSSLPTPQSLASSGLDAVAQEVVDLCRRVARLAEHDREVHARHYDAVIRECLLSLS